MLEVVVFAVWGVCGILALSIRRCSHVNNAEAPGHYMRTMRDWCTIALGPLSLLMCLARALARPHLGGKEGSDDRP